MRVTRLLIALAVFSLLTLGGVFFVSEAQNKENTALTLARFELDSLDGDKYDLNHDRFKDGTENKRLAFVFLTDWSQISLNQAKLVLNNSDSLGGEVVFVCGGDKRNLRALRTKMTNEIAAAANALWLVADASAKTDFAAVFDDESTLNQVPALVVLDKDHKAVHASTGELSESAIKEALSATREG